ncbi:MAG: TolC family protein [Planctomycetes bacterium]|nr:TolC family protein [Planctomycetota bacterium]
MPRPSHALPALALAALAILGGCARHECCSQSSITTRAGVELPPIERGHIVAEVPADAMPPFPEDQHPYVALAAAECQCMAVEHSLLGNLLEREKNAVALGDLNSCAQKSRCAVVKVLDAAAREARNKNGADALRLYYGLAEVEAGLDAIDASRPLIDDVLAKADQIKAGELSVPFDRTEFERRRAELISKRADLIARRAKMNAQLRGLLGMSSAENDAYYWPTEPLALETNELDAESEVGYGLATRAQLQLLRELPGCGATTGLDAVRELLGASGAGLGLKTKLAALRLHSLCQGCSKCEPCARQGQLAEMSENRENQIAAEIRAAVIGILARRRQVAEAQEQLDSWRHRFAQLQELRETGASNFIDLNTAKLRIVEAEQAVVSAAAELKRAEVELHELEGAIVFECGR